MHAAHETSAGNQRRLKVFMTGLRGFPGIQGGVETHAEQLCTQLVRMGCDVEVAVRSPSMERSSVWQGIRLTRLWAPRSSGMEAVIHTFLAVLVAAMRRPDILHIHAVGPGLMAPLARLLGLRVIVTNHGPDYDRQKWGFLARTILRVGEWLSARFANRCVAISHTVGEALHAKYRIDPVVIPNGVKSPTIRLSTEVLTQLGVAPKRYVLLVARLVEEKRHLDLISAFREADLPAGWKLVLVGDADHHTDYVDRVRDAAAATPGVVLAGLRTGEELAEIFSHAALFVLPSSHEGMPIALMEALSYGIPSIASEIPANRETEIPVSNLFPVGHVGRLAAMIRDRTLDPARRADEAVYLRALVLKKFTWSGVARRTLSTYREVAGLQQGVPVVASSPLAATTLERGVPGVAAAAALESAMRSDITRPMPDRHAKADLDLESELEDDDVLPV